VGESEYLIDEDDDVLDTNTDFDDSDNLRHFDPNQKLSPLYLIPGPGVCGSESAYSLRQKYPLGLAGVQRGNEWLRVYTAPECGCGKEFDVTVYKKGFVVAREGESFLSNRR